MSRSEGVSLDTWDRLSGCYGRQLWMERPALRMALDLVAPGPDDRVLDIGTGTGAVLGELASRPVRPREAVGLDTSPAMLARVPALPDGWAVRQGDGRTLPFAAGAFDVAVAGYVLHVLPEAALPTVLSELRRVLTPGGRLVTVTPVVPATGPLRLPAAALDEMARRAPAWLGGLRAFDPRHALQNAGFMLMRARTLQRGYPSLCILVRTAGQPGDP